ncbi:nucleotide disphospho-sugar-binding domain-containing protein [Streptomyces lushanensis]|uniref:nucleotide disphospho-sugar-binding domain-containing protein n=1 Tax=Streptomyces lushanensis TaxID=1434255 RepID=UPI00083039BC|nr:nucleotide disphospho-sugar-binding domain-containing protein [Streptomyces lushanensis]
MRVLFVVWPMAAHLYPIVPLARAFQAAGHETRVASHPALLDEITGAGLTAVSVGTPDTMPPLSEVGDYVLPEEERNRLAKAFDVTGADEHAWFMFSYFALAGTRIFHSPGGAPGGAIPGTDHLVDIAQAWGPDLVLWDMWPAAAVAARVTGAAHARYLWGPDYCGWARQRYRKLGGAEGTGHQEPLAEAVTEAARRHGVTVDDELLLGQVTLDPTPPVLRLATPAPAVSMRRLPYTGADAVPDWLHARPGRPRVAVTLGMSGREYATDGALVAKLLKMVDGLDIEVVATFNDVQLAGQRVPDNVRALDYVPFNQLLPTCSAVVHHGGSGTVMAAVAHRVPQLIVEKGLESATYAPYVMRHGAGLTFDHERQSAEVMRDRLLRLLHEPSFRTGAQALHAEWLTMPSPREVVPVLEELTRHHRLRV